MCVCVGRRCRQLIVRHAAAAAPGEARRGLTVWFMWDDCHLNQSHTPQADAQTRARAHFTTVTGVARILAGNYIIVYVFDLCNWANSIFHSNYCLLHTKPLMHSQHHRSRGRRTNRAVCNPSHQSSVPPAKHINSQNVTQLHRYIHFNLHRVGCVLIRHICGQSTNP